MPTCAVKNCRNSPLKTKKADGVTYHRFPQNDRMREKWRKIIAKDKCDQNFKPNDSSLICSRHFLESDIYITDKGYRRLRRTAFPRIKVDTHVVKETISTPLQSENTVKIDNAEILKVDTHVLKESLSTPLHTEVIIKKEIDNAEDLVVDTHVVKDSLLTPLHTEVTIKDEIDNSEDLDDNTHVIKETMSTPLHTENTIKVEIDIAEDMEVDAHVKESLSTPLKSEDTNKHEIDNSEDLEVKVFASQLPNQTVSSQNAESQSDADSTSSILDSRKTTRYKNELRKCHIKLKIKNRQLRNLRNQNKRLMRRNASLKQIIVDLRKKCLINKSLQNNLKDTDDSILKILASNKKQSFATYPPALRKFALTVFFHSPPAYRYLRRIFNKCLPHPSTLFKWCQIEDGQTAFTKEAMLRLAEKIELSTEPHL